MNQIGQSTKKLSIFQNENNNDNNNDDNNDDDNNDDDNNDDDNDNDNDNDDTHPPWIIVRVGMIFRRGQK